MSPGQKPEAGLSVGGLSCVVGLFVCDVSRSLAESLVSGPHVHLSSWIVSVPGPEVGPEDFTAPRKGL